MSIPCDVSLTKTELYLCNTGSIMSDCFNMQCGQCICNYRKCVNYKFIFHFHPLRSHSLSCFLFSWHITLYTLYAAVERHSGHNPAFHHKAGKCQQGPVRSPTLALLSIFYW
jgi:hypothetical protein